MQNVVGMRSHANHAKNCDTPIQKASVYGALVKVICQTKCNTF